MKDEEDEGEDDDEDTSVARKIALAHSADGEAATLWRQSRIIVQISQMYVSDEREIYPLVS